MRRSSFEGNLSKNKSSTKWGRRTERQAAGWGWALRRYSTSILVSLSTALAHLLFMRQFVHDLRIISYVDGCLSSPIRILRGPGVTPHRLLSHPFLDGSVCFSLLLCICSCSFPAMGYLPPPPPLQTRFPFMPFLNPTAKVDDLLFL